MFEVCFSIGVYVVVIGLIGVVSLQQLIYNEWVAIYSDRYIMIKSMTRYFLSRMLGDNWCSRLDGHFLLACRIACK